MVLAELGSQITNALLNMRNSTIIDQTVIDNMLKEICNALIASDVNVKLVLKLRTNIKNSLNLEEIASGINKRKLVQKVNIYTLVILNIIPSLLIIQRRPLVILVIIIRYYSLSLSSSTKQFVYLRR